MTPQAYCQNIAIHPGSSLYYSLLPLPVEQRQALTVCYAFVREVSEIGNAGVDESVAQVKLNWWRQELERLFVGQPQHPLAQALAPLVASYSLKSDDFFEIIEGVAMTLEYQAYPSFRELTLYCHRLGSMPLVLSAGISGYEQGGTVQFAHELGLFLHLLRILRHVRQDANHGRCYLPEDEMRQFGVRFEDLCQRQTSPAMQALFHWQAQRMRDTYRRAFAALPEADRYQQRQLIVLAELASAVLDEIETEGFRVVEHHIALTPLRKLWTSWRINRREHRRHRQYLATTEPVSRVRA